MKLYLAHPLDLRHEIRQIELEIENLTGIELINPFYDTGRDDIEAIDRGEKTRSSQDLNPATIVGKDLGQIMVSDGVIAYIDKKVHQIGTICECWACAVQYHKPVYVVSADCLTHPWVRFMIASSGGEGFESWDAFIKWNEWRK